MKFTSCQSDIIRSLIGVCSETLSTDFLKPYVPVRKSGFRNQGNFYFRARCNRTVTLLHVLLTSSKKLSQVLFIVWY